jgi:hypothetical protein
MNSTAKLLQRVAKRQKSNKDLERTVKYLRALYNQVRPKDPAQLPDLIMHKDDETPESLDEEEVRALMNKTVFMVAEDREYNIKKRSVKENVIGKAKMDMWARW